MWWTCNRGAGSCRSNDAPTTYDRNDISRTSTGGKRQQRNEGGSYRRLDDVNGTASWDLATPVPREVGHVAGSGVAPGRRDRLAYASGGGC
jgi:hypothetical protein